MEVMDSDIGLVKAPRLCDMIKEENGYGFNLHGEKGVVGQYISAIDQGGPADKAGMCVGDRVIEVNGVNVESLSHADVVANIRLKPDRTVLLVVDKITDNYLKKIGRPVTEDLVGYSTVHEIKIKDGNIAKCEEDTDGSKDVVDGGFLTESKMEEEKRPTEKSEDARDSEREHESSNSVGIEEQVAAVTLENTEKVPSEKADENTSDLFPTYESLDPAFKVELMEEAESNDNSDPSYEELEKEPLPVEVESVPLSMKVRPASVPKRKQVKQANTNWKAKQDLFNNL